VDSQFDARSVVIATRIYAPEPAAASFRLAALARSIRDTGARVTVLTTRPVGGRAAPEPGVAVRRWPVLRDRSGYVRGYLQYMSFDIPLFFRLMLASRPDVVVVEPPPTSGFVVRLACALRRIPYVYYAADIWSDAAESTGAPAPVVRFVRVLERAALRSAARVIAVTDGVAERVLAIAEDADVRVVANGVDTDIFTPDGARRAEGPVAVYAGTTSEWQGADIFIRALPRVLRSVPDARIVFVGQGSAWQGLAATAAELGLDRVEFVDVVPPREAAAWLRSATVGLVSLKPDQGYDFAFPTKIYAALASGAPVLFAGPGPAAALVRSGRLGTAVDYDVDSVADAMIANLTNPLDENARVALAAWVDEHASLRQTAAKAAAVVVTGRASSRMRT